METDEDLFYEMDNEGPCKLVEQDYPDESSIHEVDESSTVKTEDQYDETEDLFDKAELHEGYAGEWPEQGTPNAQCIDEVDDSSSLEHETPDEMDIDQVHQWTAAAQSELAHFSLEQSFSLSEIPMEMEPPNWEQVHALLSQFFVKRVQDKTQTMNWSLNENLPRRGRDTEFDKLLQDLGILSNRRYQSQRWLEFWRNHGLVPAPIYKWNDSKLLRDQLSSNHMEISSILNNSIEKTKKILKQANSSVDCHGFIFMAIGTYIKSYLLNEIQRFGDSLLDTLNGATPTTIDKLVSHQRNKIINHWRQSLIKLVLTLFPLEKEKELKLRIFFGRLHRELYNEWQDKLSILQCIPMAEDVEETVIQERLSASESDVYCIAGWLLFKLLCCNLRGLDAKVLSDFGTFNLLSANEAITLGMPSDEVDFRENKKARGVMNRPGSKWFHFVRLLEALYMVNMTACQVLHHRGKVLEMITATTRKSVALRELFKRCIPDHFETQARKSLMRAYFMLILPCYGKMKSSDILKLERESRPTSCNLPTRLNALIAHEKAKGS
jgi:hypothetical protein